MSDLKRVQTIGDLPPGFGFEIGVRDKGPQDADWMPSALWVERVPSGSAKASCCDGGFTTGWKDAAEVKALAAEHLRALHGLDVLEWRP